MTRKANYASKAAIKRLLDIAKEEGINVGGLEFGPDGTIRILDKDAIEPAKKPQDEWEEWFADDKKRA